MFLGVPLVPFFIGAGGVFILAMYTGQLLLLFLMPILIFIMRMMAKRDEMIFHLMGLRLGMRLRMRNLGFHGGNWVFNPNSYRPKPGPK